MTGRSGTIHPGDEQWRELVRGRQRQAHVALVLEFPRANPAAIPVVTAATST
jgi:hypothetical protein